MGKKKAVASTHSGPGPLKPRVGHQDHDVGDVHNHLNVQKNLAGSVSLAPASSADPLVEKNPPPSKIPLSAAAGDKGNTINGKAMKDPKPTIHKEKVQPGQNSAISNGQQQEDEQDTSFTEQLAASDCGRQLGAGNQQHLVSEHRKQRGQHKELGTDFVGLNSTKDCVGQIISNECNGKS
ncbi:Hypothetical predicted protein [Olea europaea subsp. europaea]|uniref:Uncharacterized protein n=1 Tax=Olea europaea subsp. europaea TaxID=158383 RepID=A0A8S0T9G9_OLEEU|nr:Hypothetical predicted protein [Olea europaea subsp. europaea]